MRSATVIGSGDWPLMMTAGRRPFSMREMRAARAGSDDCPLDDCWSGVRTLERLVAATLGESHEELAAAIAREPKSAVKTIRVFAVVNLMCEFMGANRTTFEGGEIRLVGCRRKEKNGLRRCSLLAEEIDQEFGNASGFFVLKPVRGVGESVE